MIVCRYNLDWGYAVAQLAENLRYKQVCRGWGSPMGSLGFFTDNPSGRTKALALTLPPTGMSTIGISWGLKKAGA
jgi:hypothetical protein